MRKIKSKKKSEKNISYLNFAKWAKIHLILLLLLFVFLKINNFFENSYIILKNNIELRLVKNYGYCEKQGYGFINEVKKKFLLTKIASVKNYNNNFPSSNWFLDVFDENKKFDYLILINPQSLDSNYNVIYKKKNCFLVKND